jgi:hypothetical protein
MITEILKLVYGNTELIGKVQDFSFNTWSRTIQVMDEHLVINHGFTIEDKEETNND